MKNSVKDYILLQGIFLISVLFFALFVSTILFMFHVSIGQVNLLLAVLCSLVVTFYFSGYSIKKTVLTTTIGLLIIMVCMFVCMHIYDWSWDGNAYRKARTGLLKYGWNPLYETFFDFAANNLPVINTEKIWYDASPAASEIIAANFYAITNNIEVGKCYTMIAASSLFFICYAFLCETKKIKKWQSVLCAFFLVINPLTLAQCVTNYNDAFMNLMLLLCLVSLLYITFYERQKYDILSWYFIFLSINIGFNIKLSMPLYLAILCGTFFLYWLVISIKKNGLNITFTNYKKHFVCFVIAVIFALCVTGSTQYVRNYYFYDNPFGGDTTGGIVAEVTNQMPTAYKDMSYLERFVCSLFSRTNNHLSLERVQWKLPFTFNGDEFAEAQSFAVRTAGWGIFFSGILLISLGVIIYSLVKNKSLNSNLRYITITLLIVFGIAICCVPGLSWSKYNQAIFWIPAAALLYIFLGANIEKKQFQGLLFWAGAIVALLLLNIVPNIDKDYHLFKEYKATYEEIEEFKYVTEHNEVAVSVGNYDFYGRYFNLFDFGITKIKPEESDMDKYSGNLFGNWGLYYNIRNGIKASGNLQDFIEYLNDYNYTFLVAVKDEASNALTEEMIQTIQSLGLEFDLRGHYRWSYLAVIDSGNVLFEDMSDSKLEYTTEIGGTTVEMQSAGYETGNVASIKIDGLEYALNQRGINIVVYDKEAGRVVDSVRVDTYKDNSFNR